MSRALRSQAVPGAVRIGTQSLSHLYLRFHVGLIILVSFGASLLASKAMLWAGIESMLIRYPLALLVSYLAFFAGVRIWLAYVGAVPLGGNMQSASSGDGSIIDPGSWSGSSGSGMPSLRGSPGLPGVRGGGGDFGGGGASSSFGNAGGVSGRSGSFFSGSGGGGAGLDLDLGDDGWLFVLLLILVAVLVTSIFGAVIYLVYSAPSVLADVAFQAMLAGGLVKSSRRWRDACWETRLLRSTWIPFTIVMVLAIATAAVATRLFPDAHTLGQLLEAIRANLG